MSLSRASTAAEIIEHLLARRNPVNIAGMARFGIRTETALGISNADLRLIARAVGRNQPRAVALFDSGIREAQLLAAYTGERRQFTADFAADRAARFHSWEMVDGWAVEFVHAGLGFDLLKTFAADEREFVRRLGFAMLAFAAVHRKKEPDATFIALLPLIERHATDSRNFVRKAVNWALRQIGKRSLACQGPALALALRLSQSTDRTARWIGHDAARELQAPATLARLASRKANSGPA